MSKTPQNRDVNAAQRAVMALELRAKKMTYADIAAQCGYATASACRKAVLRELDRVVVSNVEELRREEAAKLDQLEAMCWERLEEEGFEKAKLFAVDRIIQISDLRAKLFGLYAKADESMRTGTIIREYGVEIGNV